MHCNCSGCGCHSEHKEDEIKWWKIILSAVLLFSGIALSAQNVISDGLWKLLWFLSAYLPVGWHVMLSALRSARKGDFFSEFMLMSVASVGAFIIGEYPEGVAVMLFYCIGEALQDIAVGKARNNIKSLIAFFPDKASVVKDDVTIEMKPSDVKIGDIIEVKPGERVALDGVLVSANAHFNTAALTGESMPRMIEKDSEVLAGMISTDSVVRLSVVRTEKESTVMRIMNLVSEASERKSPTELFIRKFSHVYTPIVFVLALLTIILPFIYSLMNSNFDYVFSQWFYRGLIFLVISCPCALVISIPLSYFGGIGAASKRGILFKGSNYLDAVAKLDTVVFDKTGTLTTGEFAVQNTVGLTEEECRTVAAIEQSSNHPIAKAIVSKWHGSDAAIQPHDIKDIAGYGLTADVNGEEWSVGTLRLMKKQDIEYPNNLDDIQETIVACARNARFIGYMLFADTKKEDAEEAVELLRRNNISRIEILSGDKQTIVDKIAKELKVDKEYGDLLPDDKVTHIEKLRSEGRNIAFVGDGINDAPVLALSNVGIAMGGLGSEIAIETADVVIQTDRPSKVADAIALGRRTRSIVYQNITFAIGVKVLIMILGTLGAANLWAAVFADVGVALLAILNATRSYYR